MLLHDKVAIVTGAGRGIGREIAIQLAAHGALVTILDVDIEGAEATASLASETVGSASAMRCDVAEIVGVKAAVESVISTHGRIDVLVNNAGIVRAGMMHKLSEADWDAVLNVNLKSFFNTSTVVASHMIESRRGAIINIASTAALRGGIGQVNYVAAKAGVVGLTKGSALELARYGVRVNAVAPGTIETDMTQTIIADPKLKSRYIDSIPLGRIGQPVDVANAVVFLASDLASFVTGQVLPVDGGSLV